MTEVPQENTARHLERWPQGASSQKLRPFPFAISDGLNHAQTSELGRLSIGRGGLPLGVSVLP